jgi:type IV pilus assembly protein PilY1
VSVWSDNWKIENIAVKAYTGDLLGNVYSIDLSDPSTATATKLATLKDASGVVQPITAQIEMASISGNKVIYIGTGRLLVDADSSTVQVQSVYAIKDKSYAANYNPRLASAMVKQSLATSGAVRTISPALPVDWMVKDGWFVDLSLTGAPAGERVSEDMSLDVGTLSVVSNRPLTASCSSGGEAWLYSFDIKSGTNVQTTSTAIATSAGVYLGSALGTKPLVVRLPNGKLIAVVRLSDASTISQTVPSLSTAVTGRRISWRELID